MAKPKGNQEQVSIHNSDPVSKIALREWVMGELGPVSELSILELYGGSGKMYDSLYTTCKKHMAFDVLPINRPTWLKGDNRMLLATRAQGWDFYDLDAFSNPWVLANDVCRLREDGIFGMAMTCCMMRSFQVGDVVPIIRRASGINQLDTSKCSLVMRWYFDIIEQLMLDWGLHGVKVLKAKYLPSKVARYTKYFAVLLEKTSPTITPLPGKLGGVTIKKAKA